MVILKNFFIALPIFLVLDYIWLGLLMNNFYKSQFGSLASKIGDSFAPNWPAAILTYIILVLGLTFFVITKAFTNNSVMQGFIMGAFYGLVVYGVYDLTNLSIIKDWSAKMTIVDIIWGMLVCSIVAGLAVYLSKMFVS